MDFIFVYITNPNRKTAEKIAKNLLSRKLIACANIFPIISFYPWKKKIVKEKEFVLIAKTAKNKFGKIKKVVEKLHPYSIPCIIRIPVSSNKKYFNWLKKEIS